MSNEQTQDTATGISRRNFLTSSAATAAMVATGNYAHASVEDTIKVALIGCGGRGTQAAEQAVTSSPNIEMVALCDLYRDRLERAARILKYSLADKYRVTDERCFTGFDGYKGAIVAVDYVLMSSLLGFVLTHLLVTMEGDR